MRVVVYDDESLEPITVIELSGLTDRDIAARGHRWRVPVPIMEEICPNCADDIDWSLRPFPVVDLHFEILQRTTPQHGRQYSWMCFTSATALAMLLDPAWLPGQRPAIDHLQKRNRQLTAALLMTLLRGK